MFRLSSNLSHRLQEIGAHALYSSQTDAELWPEKSRK